SATLVREFQSSIGSPRRRLDAPLQRRASKYFFTMLSTRIGLLIAVAASATMGFHARVAAEQDAEECFARRLAELDPLPKVHYSWPLPTSMLTPSHRALLEFVRVTHAVSLRGESATGEQVDAAVQACAQTPTGGSGRWRPTIAINYSPWHRRFSSSLPATDTGLTAEQETAL